MMANAQVEVNFLENGRGGFYLLHVGYKFSVKTRRNERCYWRCVERQCPATLTTLNNIPVSFRQNHNHPSDVASLAADAFVSSVKQRCREDVSPIPTIYDEELGSLRNKDFDEDVEGLIRCIPTYYSCKSSLYRSRLQTLPKLPTSQADIDLDGDWKDTLAGERFLLCDNMNDGRDRILVFSTDDNLKKLCESDVIIADGTFYSCPGLFTQLYTLHGTINGSVFPLVFALLPNKKEDTYVRFFTLLRDAVLVRDSVLTPGTFLLDFEIAAWNSVNTVFPLAQIRGCFFHYCQCIWRKVQGCGLATRYCDDDNLKRLVRRAAALPLVPPDQIEDVWFNALEENMDFSAEVTRFTDYVTETWVERDRRTWNHFSNDGPRTTNNAEGWHSKVNKICQRAHPNIYAMVRLLQKIQSTNEAKIIQLLAGGRQRPKSVKYRQLDERLQTLKDRL